jgi:hypothetical protein
VVTTYYESTGVREEMLDDLPRSTNVDKELRLEWIY